MDNVTEPMDLTTENGYSRLLQENGYSRLYRRMVTADFTDICRLHGVHPVSISVHNLSGVILDHVFRLNQ